MRPEIQRVLNKIEELRVALKECDSQHGMSLDKCDLFCDDLLCDVIEKMLPDEIEEYAIANGVDISPERMEVVRKGIAELIFKCLGTEGNA